MRARLIVRAQPGYDDVAQERRRRAIVDNATRRLYQFIHPVTGGPDGTGWPFGGSLTLADVYPLLQREADVEYVDEVRFRQVTLQPSGLPTIGPDERLVRVAETELVCSFVHEIEVQEDTAEA